MKRNLLLTVAAAVCLTCPATAPADPPQSGRDAQAQPQKPAKGQGGPAGGQHGGAAGPGAAAVHLGQATTGQFQAGRGGSGGQGVTGVQAQVRVKSLHVQGGSQGSQAGAVTGSTGRPNFSSVSRSSFTGQVQQDAGQTVRHQALVRQLTRPPANVPVLSGWTRGVTGPARDQQDQQWRQAHTGWDSGAPWRSNQNWWRGNIAFRLFAGERLGFFFIPELG
ncbi:MAG TPA: hypothetical protein VN814_06735, partial [Caulobacteraceae bacterium]|nr:hypothetical protein [Caulobacteraceae bacterium]